MKDHCINDLAEFAGFGLILLLAAIVLWFGRN